MGATATPPPPPPLLKVPMYFHVKDGRVVDVIAGPATDIGDEIGSIGLGVLGFLWGF